MDEKHFKKMSPLQSKIYEIFLAVKKICDDNNLRYFAIGGTCLGAVRHHGFIPWDDDLDLGMPDKDFKKFMEIAPLQLPEYLELVDVGDLDHMFSLHAKVHDTRTTFVNKMTMPYPDSYMGVFVDIMPICGMPGNKVKRRLYEKALRFLIRANANRRTSFSDKEGSIAKLLWLLVKPINFIVPMNFYSNLWHKIAFSTDFDSTEYTAFLWTTDVRRYSFKKCWFEECVEMPFETTTISCPKGWHEYLTKHFGDYMELPPEADRRGWHGFSGLVDLDRPYKYYQENGAPKQ